MGFMIPLDAEASKDIDLEIGVNLIVGEKEGGSCDVSGIGNAANHQQVQAKKSLTKDFALARVDDRSSEKGKIISFLCEEKEKEKEKEKMMNLSLLGKERLKEKAPRKPPSKPPKPPKPPNTTFSFSLDAAEQKMLSELAIQKRLRMERIKSLRNMNKKKNANAGFNSTTNLCALFVTILFCLIIIWHGMTSKGSSVVEAPEPSLLHQGEFQKKTKKESSSH